MCRSKSTITRWLPVLMLLGALLVFPISTALAQVPPVEVYHGIGSSKGCVGPILVGQKTNCVISAINSPLIDTALDTLTVTGIFDTVNGATRVPTVGNLPIIEVGGGASCPGGGFPCTLPSGGFVRVLSNTYVVLGTDPKTLPDNGTILWNDTCSGGATGCNTSAQTATAPSATTIVACIVAADCGAAPGVCGANTCIANVCGVSYSAATTVCRTAVAGGCDVAENCTGSSAACPADVFASAATVCRAAVAGVCDVAENCTGSSAACPADVFASATTVCRAAVAGGCDVAENCTGNSAACPADAVAPVGTVCRVAAAGGCDVAETCTGTNACPTDGFAPNTTVCRTAVPGGCDIAENCTGNSVTCPADVVAPIGTVCRVAASGGCDVPESCTGTNTCPTDAFAPNTTVCRVAAAGGCDVAETCTGSAAACPTDVFVSAGTECRAGDSTTCNPAESCTGTSASCPADVNPGCHPATCRTVGYWGTHAGTEKLGSLNVTGLAILANGGSISVCGLTLTNTDLNSSSSALEVLCDPGGGKSQLERQLTALALNCVASGSPSGGAACDGITAFEAAFNACNTVCVSGDKAGINACIDVIDCLNNGGTPSLTTNNQFFCATGKCSDNDAANCTGSYRGLCTTPGTATCNPALSCHDNPLPWPDSPAGSPNSCNDAKKTKCEPGITSCTNP